MPAQEGPTPATRLKPLRGFQLIASMVLFHLASFMNSHPDMYMSIMLGDILLITSFIYVCLITVALSTLREGDAIRTSTMMTFRLLGIPFYIIFPIICYFISTTDFSYWIVKNTFLLCFLLAGSFVIEALIMIREFRR